MSAEEFLDNYVKYVENMKEEVKISSKIENMNGSRSTPSDILTETKSLVNTLDKADQRQLTAFGLRLFEVIVYKFISNSNVKSGL